MSILKISRLGHLILLQKAQPVKDIGENKVKKIIHDMTETMLDAKGIGLAAPQVHINKQIIIFRTPEEEQNKEEKNLESALLLQPDNEEAILMLMKIGLEKSNYSKVKKLSKTFIEVCIKLCDENKDILDTLSNIEPKNNES